jgi:hypothetical protein
MDRLLRWLLIVAWLAGFGAWIWFAWFSPDPWLAKHGICLVERENPEFPDRYISGDALSHYTELVPVLCEDPATSVGDALGGYNLRVDIVSRSAEEAPTVEVNYDSEEDGSHHLLLVPRLDAQETGPAKFSW